MTTISYVILHYLSLDDTIDLVSSIENLDKSDSIYREIVIVDNGSNNNTGEKLKELYSDKSHIHILISNTNDGFTEGNNKGFRYAKYTLKSDYILLLNNDTVIKQKDFEKKILKKSMEYQFDILGPDIITLDGQHQNPQVKQSWTLSELIIFRFKKRIQKYLLFSGRDTFRDVSSSLNKVDEDIINTNLHGACLIFSSSYISKFDGLVDGPFLYMEEDLLKLRADYNKLKMVYTPELQIYHKEDISTNMIFSDQKDKKIYKINQIIKSSKIYSKQLFKYKIRAVIYSFLIKIISYLKKSEYKIDIELPLSYIVRIILIRGGMLLRGFLYRIRHFHHINKPFFLGKKCQIKCSSKLNIGAGVTIHENVELDAVSMNGITLSDNSSIGKNTIVRCSGSLSSLGNGFFLGKNSSLADNCFIGASGGVHIGDNVIGGQNIRFHSSNHNFNSMTKLIKDQGTTTSGIVIGNNCWIGAGVVFCDGCVIEDGCVIGANAVVTKSFPKNSVIVGNPAKVIKKRGD